jgi:hypothetical protein
LLRGRREVVTAQERRAVPELVAYWFVDGERVVATHAGRIWRDAWNRLNRGGPDRWAYVSVQTGADGWRGGGEDPDAGGAGGDVAGIPKAVAGVVRETPRGKA